MKEWKMQEELIKKNKEFFESILKLKFEQIKELDKQMETANQFQRINIPTEVKNKNDLKGKKKSDQFQSMRQKGFCEICGADWHYRDNCISNFMQSNKFKYCFFCKSNEHQSGQHFNNKNQNQGNMSSVDQQLYQNEQIDFYKELGREENLQNQDMVTQDILFKNQRKKYEQSIILTQQIEQRNDQFPELNDEQYIQKVMVLFIYIQLGKKKPHMLLKDFTIALSENFNYNKTFYNRTQNITREKLKEITTGQQINYKKS